MQATGAASLLSVACRVAADNESSITEQDVSDCLVRLSKTGQAGESAVVEHRALLQLLRIDLLARQAAVSDADDDLHAVSLTCHDASPVFAPSLLFAAF
jgi:hypothetical protein